METSQNVRRFRTNPIEIVIFAVVTIVFGNSIYRLFYDTQKSGTIAFLQSETRNVASSASNHSSGVFNIDLPCGSELSDQNTSASKIRVTGGLCAESEEAAELEKTLVTNTANRFSATVFTTANPAKFSTDYIPLNTGRNSIHLEFIYKNGRSLHRDLTVNRN